MQHQDFFRLMAEFAAQQQQHHQQALPAAPVAPNPEQQPQPQQMDLQALLGLFLPMMFGRQQQQELPQEKENKPKANGLRVQAIADASPEVILRIGANGEFALDKEDLAHFPLLAAELAKLPQQAPQQSLHVRVAADEWAFRHMLNFSRGGSRHLLWDLSIQEKWLLRSEAERFGLAVLVQELDWFLQPEPSVRLRSTVAAFAPIAWSVLLMLKPQFPVCHSLVQMFELVAVRHGRVALEEFAKFCDRLVCAREFCQWTKESRPPSLTGPTSAGVCDILADFFSDAMRI
jgi:hypothetical protein